MTVEPIRVLVVDDNPRFRQGLRALLQATGATDGRFLNNAGIATYGVSGMFRDPDGNGVHGLNERLRVKSLYDGQEFLYRLVKALASQQ